MQQSELDAVIMKVRDEGFDEAFIRFCAETFSSHTYPAKNLAAARMHAFFLRLALDSLCNPETKAEVLSAENPGQYVVDEPETLCLQLSGECYRDALNGGEPFCELFIRKWCGILAC